MTNNADCVPHPHAVLTSAFERLLPVDFERHESETIKAAARRDRLELASRLASSALTTLRPPSWEAVENALDDALYEAGFRDGADRGRIVRVVCTELQDIIPTRHTSPGMGHES